MNWKNCYHGKWIPLVLGGVDEDEGPDGGGDGDGGDGDDGNNSDYEPLPAFDFPDPHVGGAVGPALDLDELGAANDVDQKYVQTE